MIATDKRPFGPVACSPVMHTHRHLEILMHTGSSGTGDHCLGLVGSIHAWIRELGWLAGRVTEGVGRRECRASQ
jgi:hypothetical protein